MPKPSSADSHNTVTDLSHNSDDHVPTSRMESVCDIDPNDRLANLVEMQQNMIAALQTEMCDMAADMSEKDKTISELKLGVADRSLNCEGQVTQLLWLESIVNEKDSARTHHDKAFTSCRS